MEENARLADEAEVTALKRKVEYLETVIDTHHITRFEENVHALKLSVRMGCKRLAAEFQVMEHDPKNAERIEELASFLEFYAKEIRQFIFQKKG